METANDTIVYSSSMIFVISNLFLLFYLNLFAPHLVCIGLHLVSYMVPLMFLDFWGIPGDGARGWEMSALAALTALKARNGGSADSINPDSATCS